MSFTALNWARNTEVGSGTAKAVLLWICDAANAETGECYLSNETLMRWSEFDHRTIRKALRLLSAKHLIERVPGRGRGNATVYRLPVCISQEAEKGAKSAPVSPEQKEGNPAPFPELKGDNVVPLTDLKGDKNVEKREQICSPNHIEPKKRKTVLRTVSSAAKGTRLSEDWVPSERDRQYAIDHGVDPDRVFEEFRNYWLSTAKNPTKLNWSLTFQNRVLACQERGLHKPISQDGFLRLDIREATGAAALRHHFRQHLAAHEQEDNGMLLEQPT